MAGTDSEGFVLTEELRAEIEAQDMHDEPDVAEVEVVDYADR